MIHRDTFTGQRVDSRAHNDNAPARYTAPSLTFKEMLAGCANPFCRNCGGTGYLGRFKHVCAGRCFKCIPENVWNHTVEAFDQSSGASTGRAEMAEIYLAVCTDDRVGPAYLSDGVWITPTGQTFDAGDTRGPNSRGSSATHRSGRLTD
jgi:hypothetical protein